MLAQAPERHHRERHDQGDHDGGHGPMAELDHLVLLEEGQDPASAQGPAMSATTGSAASEAGVADPHHPTDHDQREGGEDGRVEQAAEANELVRFATRGEMHPGQATGASAGPPSSAMAASGSEGGETSSGGGGGRQAS